MPNFDVGSITSCDENAPSTGQIRNWTEYSQDKNSLNFIIKQTGFQIKINRTT